MKEIIFLGDSITAWNPRKDIKNYGIPGDTVRDVFWRIEEVETEGELYLMIGINDILMGLEKENTLGYYKKLLIKLKEKYNEIYVVSILPISEMTLKNKKVISLNKEISKLCLEMNVRFIDIYKEFLDERGLLSPKYTIDGVHLSLKGYKILNQLVSQE